MTTACCFMSVTLATIVTLAICGCTEQKKTEMTEMQVKEIDLSGYRDANPTQKMRLLFIHHSSGGIWLADNGQVSEIVPGTGLYYSHPNGGGLRAMLQRSGYEVHEAGYKSAIGDRTDVCDWNAKFRDRMNEILRCNQQDDTYQEASVRNDIVMFKSCFPANAIESEGKEPGDPDSAVKTTANYKAAYTKLLSYFKAHPETLFVCITAPPLAEPSGLKQYVKNLLWPAGSTQEMGARARRFNNWLKDADNGWLVGYEGTNVVVFDYYDLLTGTGKSNNAFYPTQGGTDSHPNAEGNSIAAREFVPFLNRAADRFAGSRRPEDSL